MELMKVMAKRKSIRQYKPEQITQNELDVILKAGCAAPISMNRYGQYQLTVVQNTAFLNDLQEKTAELFKQPGMNPTYNAPALIIVSGAANPQSPNVEYADAGCIVENMHLAATDLGLGSVYIYGCLRVLSGDEGLMKELHLPEGLRPLSALAVGYSDTPDTPEKELKITIAMNRIE